MTWLQPSATCAGASQWVVLDSADSHAAAIGMLQNPFDKDWTSRSNQRDDRPARGLKIAGQLIREAPVKVAIVGDVNWNRSNGCALEVPEAQGLWEGDQRRSDIPIHPTAHPEVVPDRPDASGPPITPDQRRSVD
jgi:hypothetical protein